MSTGSTNSEQHNGHSHSRRVPSSATSNTSSAFIGLGTTDTAAESIEERCQKPQHRFIEQARGVTLAHDGSQACWRGTRTGTAGKVGWALTSSPGHEADAACGNAGRACVSQASFEGAKGEGRQWDKGQILRCHSAVRGQLRRHRSRQSACGVFREEAWQHAQQAGEAGGPAREKAGERIRTAHGLCNGVLLERWQLWQSDGRVSDIQYVWSAFCAARWVARYRGSRSRSYCSVEEARGNRRWRTEEDRPRVVHWLKRGMPHKRGEALQLTTSQGQAHSCFV